MDALNGILSGLPCGVPSSALNWTLPFCWHRPKRSWEQKLVDSLVSGLELLFSTHGNIISVHPLHRVRLHGPCKGGNTSTGFKDILEVPRNIWMWHPGTQLSGELGSSGLMVELNDFGVLQSQFYSKILLVTNLAVTAAKCLAVWVHLPELLSLSTADRSLSLMCWLCTFFCHSKIFLQSNFIL